MSLTAYLSDLIPTAITNGWGPYERDRSNGEIVSLDGGKLTLNGTPYAKGLGVHANSSLTYFLGGSYSRFESVIGIDDEVGDNGSVVFSVLADGVQIFRSNILTGTSDPVPVDLNVAGVETLQLIVDEANGSKDYDHANWADAKLTSAMEPSLSNDLTDTSSGGTSRGEEPYFLPVSQKTQLQSALDTYGTVRLEALGDYSIGNPDLVLRSNQKLIGSVRTKTPSIIVQPGTTNAYVYSVDANITFPEGLAPTTRNTFIRVNDVTVNNAVVEENTFVATKRIDVDTYKQGYFRNNTLYRALANIWSPSLKLVGDVNRNSYGNKFFAFNFLFPAADSAIIENQGDFKLFGADLETWNSRNEATKAGTIYVRNTGRVELTAINAGFDTGNAAPLPLFDIQADELVFTSGEANVSEGLRSYLRAGTKKSAFVDISGTGFSVNDEAINPFRFNAFNRSGDYRVNGAVNPTLTTGQQNDLRSLLSFDGPGKRYTHEAIPDPLGPNWKVGLADRPDSTNYIRSLVNSQGIARLGEGVFYISDSIVLKKGQGIIGAGMDKTVIVAKNSSVDMIVYDSSQYDPRLAKPDWHDQINLADLTLQGGRNGVLIPSNRVGDDLSGYGEEFAGNYTSRVVFRGMSEAGFSFTRIYGYDNNMFEYVYFVDNVTGLKQIVPDDYPGPPVHSPETTFMDKTTFYRSQFVNNGIGLDLQTKRPNVLNSYIETLFQGNRDTAVKMINNEQPLFISSDFIDNGLAISSDKDVNIYNSYFRSSGTPLIKAGFNAEATIFEGAEGSQILPSGKNSNMYMYESRSSIPIGAPQSGFFSNNVLEDNLGLSGGVAFLSNNVISDIAW